MICTYRVLTADAARKEIHRLADDPNIRLPRAGRIMILMVPVLWATAFVARTCSDDCGRTQYLFATGPYMDHGDAYAEFQAYLASRAAV